MESVNPPTLNPSAGTGGSVLNRIPMLNTLLSGLTGLFSVYMLQAFGGSNNLFINGIGLIVVNYFVSNFIAIWNHIWYFFKRKLFSSLTISSSDESYEWLMDWISTQKYTKNYGELSVFTSWGDHQKWTRRGMGSVYTVDDEDSGKKRPRLIYLPYFGSHFFFHKRRMIWVNRQRDNSQNTMSKMGAMMYGYRRGGGGEKKFENEILTISTFGIFRRGTHFLKKLLVECMEDTLKEKEGKTWIYTNFQGGQSWKRSSAKKIRALDSVILPKGKKKMILKDIKNFIDSQEWYNQAGVPWRRGILFYGVPGSGKTSLILALAGALKMSVAILSLSSTGMNDYFLQILLDNAPKQAFILIEDIDHCLEERKVDKNMRVNIFNQSGVTFSGLLNALDGASTAEGRLLFMTTNKPEKLQHSLIRPGRVDLKVEFKNSTKTQIRELFLKFYPKEKDTAIKLAEKIPEFLLSCAELQGVYLLHRENPKGILDKIDEHLEEIKREREKERVYFANKLKEKEKKEKSTPVIKFDKDFAKMMTMMNNNQKQKDTKDEKKEKKQEEKKQVEGKKEEIVEKKDVKEEKEVVKKDVEKKKEETVVEKKETKVLEL